MLPATTTKLLQLDPVRSRLPVLGRRIIALFAITALQRNNFSGHCSLPVSREERIQNTKLMPAFLLLTSGFPSLLNNFADGAGADRVAAFTNREA